MDEKKEIINRINKIAGKYSTYEVFTDWIRCSALAMSNAVTDAGRKIWAEREKGRTRKSVYGNHQQIYEG